MGVRLVPVIVSVTTGEAEAAKSALPEYVAFRLSVPAGRPAVEKVAMPEELTAVVLTNVAPL